MGATHPDLRAVPCRYDLGALGDAGENADRVFNFLKNSADPFAAIGLSRDEVAVLASALGFPLSQGNFTYGWDAWRFLAQYLGMCLVGGWIPEDDEREQSPDEVAYDWPDQGDHLARRVFTWDLKTTGWGGTNNVIPRVEVRRVYQLQKWSNKDKKWHIYNQYGHNLTFEWFPKDNQWRGGANVQTWLDEHAQDLQTAWTIFWGACLAIVTLGAGAAVGAAATSLSKGSEALARAAAGGKVEDILKALAGIASAAAQLPGVTDFVDKFKSASIDTAQEILNVPAVQTAIQIISDAKNQTEDIIKRVEDLRKQAVVYVDEVKAQAQKIRNEFVPSYLQPWFDRAFILKKDAAGKTYKTLAANRPVPDYALSAWNVGAALGSLSGDMQPWEMSSTYAPAATAAFLASRKAAATPAISGPTIAIVGGVLGLLEYFAFRQKMLSKKNLYWTLGGTAAAAGGVYLLSRGKPVPTSYAPILSQQGGVRAKKIS